MIDYQSVVDEIRFALQSEDCELTDERRQANLDYVEACRDVNRRLRRIGELLDAGLRSEAIQLGEGPPNVIDLVSVLSFAEAEEWADVASLYDLPRAEKLNTDVANQLSEAQLIEQPLQKLLDRHRRLALIRAPLRMRLSVLRELNEADPETFTWEEDVRAMETAAFQELAGVARDAERSGNINRLKQIFSDLSSEEWLETPPQGLLNRVRKSLAGVTQQSAREQIVEIAGELEAAFNELDLARSQAARARWNVAYKQAKLPADDPLIEQVSPVLGWIQDEEQREAAEKKYNQTILALEHAIDSGAPLDELQRLRHEVDRLDRTLPELLASRYRSRIDALQLAQSRLHRLQLGSVVAGVLLLFGLVGFLVYRQMRTSEVQTLAAHVEQLLDDRQYEEAQTALAGRGDVNRWESLLALKARADRELKEEQARDARLQSGLARARDADEYSVAIAALSAVEGDLLTDEEKHNFAQLEQEWENRHRQKMAAREQALQAKIQAIASDVVASERSVKEQVIDEQLTERLNEIVVALAKLKGEAQGVRPEFLSQVTLLESRTRDLQKVHKDLLARAERQKSLTSRALILSEELNPDRAVTAFRQALIAYGDGLASQDETKALQAVAHEENYWRAALQWSNLKEKWQSIWPKSVDASLERIKQCEEFQKEFPGAPDADVIAQYVAQLNAIQAREGPINQTEPGLKERLAKVYENPLIADSWVFETESGQVFYLPEKMSVPDDKLFTFSHFVGYGKGDLARRGDIPPKELIRLSTVESPSSQLADWVSKELVSVSTQSWNEFAHALSLKLVLDQTIDPFLRLDLLRRTLEAAAEGDTFLKRELENHLKLLQTAPINPLALWMSPDDADGRKASEESARVLVEFRRLKDLDDVWSEADEARERFERQLKLPTEMMGWLDRTADGWSCRSKWKPTSPTQLYVIYVDDSKSASQWRQVGKASPNECEIADSASSFCVAGRPVFVIHGAVDNVASR